MAGPFYAKSTTGVNTNSGLDFANANLDLAGCIAEPAVAGDIIYVSHVHAESGAALTLAFPGTPAAPNKVICGNDAASPPTTLANTATITSTSTITVNGSVSFDGVAFKPGSGGTVTQSFASCSTAASNQEYNNCVIELLTTGTGQAKIGFGDEGRTDSNRVTLNNTNLKLGGVNHRIKIACNFRQYGGSFLAGASPVNVHEVGLRGIGEWLVVGTDYSANLGTAFNLLLQSTLGHPMTAKFYGIKLPASWSGKLWSAKPTIPNQRVEVRDSLIGTTRVRAWDEDYQGESRDNVAIYRNGGFVDDVDAVNFSIKMVSSANTSYPIIGHRGIPLNFTVSTSGSPITKYIEVVHDAQGSGTGGALTNGEMTLELLGPGGFVSNIKASFLAAPADHATSSETWTGTGGMASPVKQRLAITFTPTRKGAHTLTPVLYAASKTVYYCMKAT